MYIYVYERICEYSVTLLSMATYTVGLCNIALTWGARLFMRLSLSMHLVCQNMRVPDVLANGCELLMPIYHAHDEVVMCNLACVCGTCKLEVCSYAWHCPRYGLEDVADASRC